MKHDYEGYAVLLGEGGRAFLAYGAGSVLPRVFRRRHEAVEFRNELAENGCSKGHVVKVRATIEHEPSLPAARGGEG